MTVTHRCDYCGKTYTLPESESIEICRDCGEFRIYDLRENRPSSHYGHVGKDTPPPAPSEEDEQAPKKSKKQSRDVKAKRNSPPSYAEQVKTRYGYKRG